MLLFATLAAFAADPVDDLPESDLPEAETPAPAPADPAAPAAPAPAGDPDDPQMAAPPAASTKPVPPPVPAGPLPATDAQIQAAIDAAYGKAVPAPARCSEVIEVTGVQSEVVVFGVKQRNIGCKLLGVLVGAKPYSVADALPAAVPDLQKRDAASRLALIGEWTTEVVLAYDYVRPETKPTVKPTPSGYAVTVPFVARTGEAHVAQEVPGAFTYGANGKLTASQRDTGPKYATGLYQHMYKVSGLTEAQIAAGIQSVGGLITRCFEERYAENPLIEDATRFAWTIGPDGKIGTFGAEESGDDELTRCYADAMRKVNWPTGVKGAAVYSFAVVRSQQ